MLGTARLIGQTSGAIAASMLFSLFPNQGRVVMYVAAALALTGAAVSMLRIGAAKRAGAKP